MSTSRATEQMLLAENAGLLARLEESEDMLRAIRSGAVDALVVESADGPQVFTLQGVDAESNRFRGEILAHVNDAVIATDPEQRITYFNPAAERLYGVTSSEALGRRLQEIFESRWLHPGDEEAALTALNERGEWRGENIHVRRDGRELYAESSVTAFGTGESSSVLAVIRDISRRKRDEQALLDAANRKDEFLAILAHELRNPLAPIRNAVQILHLKGPAAPELQWARNMIDRQVQQMARLIDDLMDVSRVSRGRIELRREHVALGDVVREAIEASRPLIEKMGHTLTVMLPPSRLLVDGDLTRLAQVFLNLLNNAAKYTDHGGRIDLRAVQRGSEVVVSIRDTGIGIPADRLVTIFEMFSQVEEALSRSRGGLGIGLSLSKRLVELHGGSIEARSDGLGKGCEFVVRLPLVVAKPEDPQALTPMLVGVDAEKESSVAGSPDPRTANRV